MSSNNLYQKNPFKTPDLVIKLPACSRGSVLHVCSLVQSCDISVYDPLFKPVNTTFRLYNIICLRHLFEVVEDEIKSDWSRHTHGHLHNSDAWCCSKLSGCCSISLSYDVTFMWKIILNEVLLLVVKMKGRTRLSLRFDWSEYLIRLNKHHFIDFIVPH